MDSKQFDSGILNTSSVRNVKSMTVNKIIVSENI